MLRPSGLSGSSVRTGGGVTKSIIGACMVFVGSGVGVANVNAAVDVGADAEAAWPPQLVTRTSKSTNQAALYHCHVQMALNCANPLPVVL